KFGYSPKTLSLAQLKFGQAGGVMVEASGNFDRSETTGHLSLNASAASLGQITSMVAPLAPAVAARLDQAATAPGAARLKLQLDLAKVAGKANVADARAAFELSAPQLSGTATVMAKPEIAAIRAFDLNNLGRNDLTIDTKFAAERADALLAMLGLDKVIAAGEGRAQFEGSVSGEWRAPLRLSAKMWGAGVDAELQGT